MTYDAQPAKRFRQFGLRTLFVVVTLVCISGAVISNRFRGERFHHSMTITGILHSESVDIARRLKLAISTMPGHQATKDAEFPFERIFNAGTYESMKKAKPAEHVFARITLSDGTADSVVGFWIYEREPWPDGKRRLEVVIVVVGHESYFDIQSGRYQAHEMERHRLSQVGYTEVVIRCLKPE
jgi:hypothetical protein